MILKQTRTLQNQKLEHSTLKMTVNLTQWEESKRDMKAKTILKAYYDQELKVREAEEMLKVDKHTLKTLWKTYQQTEREEKNNGDFS
jgi:hypothetical protein